MTMTQVRLTKALAVYDEHLQFPYQRKVVAVGNHHSVTEAAHRLGYCWHHTRQSNGLNHLTYQEAADLADLINEEMAKETGNI
jgi:hypothetical protein